MSRRLLRSRKARLVTVLVVALVAVSGAFAYFTATGSGSGNATVGSTQSVTINAATPSTALYPGGSSDVAASIDNPNTIAVHLPSLQLDSSQGTGGFDVDSTHQSAGCTVPAAGLTFTGSDNSGSGFVVPAKVGAVDGTLPVDLAGALAMDTTAVNACHGATITVYLKVGS